MKKFLCLMLILVPAFTFAKPNKNEKVLIDQGVELCQKIKEKASCEVYLRTFVSDQDLLLEAKEFSCGDFTKLESISRVKINEKSLYDMFVQFGFSDEGLPEDLRKELFRNLIASIPSLLNGRLGSFRLAASLTLISSSVFDVNFSFDRCIYIFQYKDAYPICVIYTHGKDKAVSASAAVIATKDLSHLLEPSDMSDLITIENIDF